MKRFDKGAVRRWLKLHRVHAMGMLAYTGHELAHASDLAFVLILCWVGMCELVGLWHAAGELG